VSVAALASDDPPLREALDVLGIAVG